jgi:hypothetical protein
MKAVFGFRVLIEKKLDLGEDGPTAAESSL